MRPSAETSHACGEIRLGAQVGAELGEPAHELLDRDDRDAVGREVPVERGRLGLQVDAQGARLGALAATARRREREQRERGRSDSSPHHRDQVVGNAPRSPGYSPARACGDLDRELPARPGRSRGRRVRARAASSASAASISPFCVGRPRPAARPPACGWSSWAGRASGSRCAWSSSRAAPRARQRPAASTSCRASRAPATRTCTAPAAAATRPTWRACIRGPRCAGLSPRHAALLAIEGAVFRDPRQVVLCNSRFVADEIARLHGVPARAPRGDLQRRRPRALQSRRARRRARAAARRARARRPRGAVRRQRLRAQGARPRDRGARRAPA